MRIAITSLCLGVSLLLDVSILSAQDTLLVSSFASKAIREGYGPEKNALVFVIPASPGTATAVFQDQLMRDLLRRNWLVFRSDTSEPSSIMAALASAADSSGAVQGRMTSETLMVELLAIVDGNVVQAKVSARLVRDGTQRFNVSETIRSGLFVPSEFDCPELKEHKKDHAKGPKPPKPEKEPFHLGDHIPFTQSALKLQGEAGFSLELSTEDFQTAENALQWTAVFDVGPYPREGGIGLAAYYTGNISSQLGSSEGEYTFKLQSFGGRIYYEMESGLGLGVQLGACNITRTLAQDSLGTVDPLEVIGRPGSESYFDVQPRLGYTFEPSDNWVIQMGISSSLNQRVSVMSYFAVGYVLNY